MPFQWHSPWDLIYVLRQLLTGVSPWAPFIPPRHLADFEQGINCLVCSIRRDVPVVDQTRVRKWRQVEVKGKWPFGRSSMGGHVIWRGRLRCHGGPPPCGMRNPVTRESIFLAIHCKGAWSIMSMMTTETFYHSSSTALAVNVGIAGFGRREQPLAQFQRHQFPSRDSLETLPTRGLSLRTEMPAPTLSGSSVLMRWEGDEAVEEKLSMNCLQQPSATRRDVFWWWAGLRNASVLFAWGFNSPQPIW